MVTVLEVYLISRWPFYMVLLNLGKQFLNILSISFQYLDLVYTLTTKGHIQNILDLVHDLNYKYYTLKIELCHPGQNKNVQWIIFTLLPTVKGVGSIPIAILPSCLWKCCIIIAL